MASALLVVLFATATLADAIDDSLPENSPAAVVVAAVDPVPAVAAFVKYESAV